MARTRLTDLAEGRVQLAHCAGGRAMRQLIEELFHAELANPLLLRGDDQAAFAVEGGRLVTTTDAYVVAPLFFPAGGSALRAMRDPTRGGLAATLNEIAQQSKVGMRLREAAISVKSQVAAACELLGLDPLNIANEGKLVAIVAAEAAPSVLAAMRDHPLGREAAIIGEVVADELCFVRMETAFGGERVVSWLAGEPLPRIC